MGRTKLFNRNDVLVAAIQVFWKKGFADTSLSDLERATGVNKSGLYSEFKDKEDLFLESLKHYRDTNPAYVILDKEPFGWHNIEEFIKTNISCKGQKGCYLANTIREYSIIPTKVKTLLAENSQAMHDLVLQNVIASKTKKNPEMITKMILTFASGISLKLNVMKPDEVKDEIENFLELVKS